MGKKILLIEDDNDTMNLYVDILKSRGFDVDSASDGEQGLLQAEKVPHDLVLLDIMMPKIDGLEVLRTLKKESPSQKIIIFTNLSSSELANEAKEKGADAFLVKSDTDPDKLLEKVSGLLAN